MKKFLLIVSTLFIGLVAVAQYANPKENKPGYNIQKNQLFPTNQANTDNPIIYKSKPAVSKSGDNTHISGVNRNSYVANTFDPTWANRFQTVLDSSAAASGVKGLSAAVLVPGQGLWTGVSGISSEGDPITSEMRFGFASNTKLYIAVTMEKLQEEGVLSLDDHLYQWLPSYLYVDSTTTIRQLLSHQSGIFDFWNDQPSYFWNLVLSDTTHFYTPQEILATIGEPHFAPGHGFWYSNTNYLLAGMVIEAATGTSWTQKLHDIIFDPLTMDSTFVGAFEPPNGPVAHEWVTNYGEVVNSPMTSAYSSVNAAGAILSTPQEMVEWYNALFNDEIISEASLQEVLNFDPTSQYGLGIGEVMLYNTHFCFAHAGAMIGCLSQMLYDVQTKSVMCVATNSRDIDFSVIIYPFINVFYNEFPKKENDAGITSIYSPWENTCNAAVTPTVSLTNFGTTPLTSVAINYKNDNDTPAIFNWTGTLNPCDTIEVILPQVTTGEGYHTFTCYTTLPNGAPEGNTYNDTIRSNFIVNTSPSVISELYESFDSGVFPPAGWAESSSSMFQWGQTSLAGYTSSGSAVKSNFYDGNFGSFYDLDLPKLNISGWYNTDFSFDYAYGYYPGNMYDSLQVFFSQDCGVTWQTLFNKGGFDLRTTYAPYYEFYPQSPDQWKHISYPLSAYEGDLLIRFRSVCGFGNNLFIDNVRVDLLTSTKENEPVAASNVFPNPFTSKTTFTYTLTEPSQVILRIYDGFGRQVAEPVNAFQQNGEQKITWDAGNLPAGIYYSRLSAGKQVMTQEIVKLK